MRIALLTSAFGLALIALPAQAELVTESLPDDQYHVVETEDGILRVDRQTGEVSECRSSSSGWVCRASADDRLAYEAEINRLDAEVSRLRDELAALENALPEGPGTLGVVPDLNGEDGENSITLTLPSDQEIDEVMDLTDELMRRLFGMVEDMRSQMEIERGQ